MAIAEFSSNAQGLFYIFLMGFWIVFLYLTLTLKGKNGKTIGFLNLMQLMFAIVIGSSMAKFTMLLAVSSIFVGVGVFVGMIIYNDASA